MKLFSKNDWKIWGDKDSAVLIAGHSHTFSMHLAIEQNSKFRENFCIANQEDLSKHKLRDETYWEFVAANSNSKKIGIAWNGNQHNIHFLIETKKPFKVYNLINDNKDYPAVSLTRVKELYKNTFDELKSIIERYFLNVDFFLIGTPPPKSKNHLDKLIKADPLFIVLGNKFAIPTSELETSSDDLRIAMWKLTQKLTSEVANQFGVNFVGVPDEATSPNGLLKDKYWTDDLTHANEKFGALMLEQVLTALRKTHE